MLNKRNWSLLVVLALLVLTTPPPATQAEGQSTLKNYVVSISGGSPHGQPIYSVSGCFKASNIGGAIAQGLSTLVVPTHQIFANGNVRAFESPQANNCEAKQVTNLGWSEEYLVGWSGWNADMSEFFQSEECRMAESPTKAAALTVFSLGISHLSEFNGSLVITPMSTLVETNCQALLIE